MNPPEGTGTITTYNRYITVTADGVDDPAVLRASIAVTTIEETITVFPAPKLIIDYELPEADLVCTTFDLRATFRNVGAGPARNMRLTGGQPRITQNTGNTPQSFKVTRVAVNGVEVDNVTMALDIGDIPPGGFGEVVWRIEAEEAGRFVDFSSDYRMLNYLGEALAPSLRGINTTFAPPSDPFEYGCLTDAFSVSGYVRDDNDTPLPGITVASASGRTAVTDADGYYILPGLVTGTYTIVPTQTGYTFLPETDAASVPPSVEDVDFTATAQNVTVEIIQPEGGAEVVLNSPITIRIRVDDGDSDYQQHPVQARLIYHNSIDPETGTPREEELLLAPAGTDHPDGDWDYYETNWTMVYPGDVQIIGIVTIDTTAYVDSVVLNVACPPMDPLSHIGDAMNTVISPATDHCGSTFEELFIIKNEPESEDGRVPFAEFGTLARNAQYEILFANMHWDPKNLEENEAAHAFLGDSPTAQNGLVGLYKEVRDVYDRNNDGDPNNDIDKYPYGMTVRILMGLPDGGPIASSKKIVLRRLYELGIPTEYPEDSDTPFWKIEVGDFRHEKGYHSHIKTMIVDGQTVIVAGYNMQNQYFGSEIETDELVIQDMGVKLSGDIAQEAVDMFDNLWLEAELCVTYLPPLAHLCPSKTKVEDIPTRSYPVSPTGTGVNAFSLYRDRKNHQAEEAMFEAMAASTSQINLMQDRVDYAEDREYILGILKALSNGSVVRYIFNCEETPFVCWKNITSYKALKEAAYKADQEHGTDYYDNLVAKTIRIDKYGWFNGRKFLHTKALSIDEKMLIVGGTNFDFSSWGGHLLAPNLSEYNIAIDYNDPPAGAAVSRYDEYFEGEWSNTDKYKLADEIININVPSSPTLVIQDLVDQAVSGSIVVIPEGIYQESVVIDKPLGLIGASTEDTVIEPPDEEPAFRVTASDVSIYNLTVRGSAGYGIELIDSSPSSLENILIRRVVLANNTLGGILIQGLIPGSPINYVIENNTFIGGKYGVRINMLEQQAITSTLRNNIFFDQTSIPIEIYSANDGGVEYSHNLFNNCIRAVNGVCPQDWYEGTLNSISSEQANLLNLDPGFMNSTAGDYNLLPASPIIDAGDPNTVNEIGSDGYTPLQADIGAFETELVVDSPDQLFQESNGQIVMEAEHFTWQLRHGRRTWISQTNLSGYTGSSYLDTLPDTGLRFETPYTSPNPELRYTINFTTTGVYTIWIRGYAPDGAGDSLYLSVEGQSAFTPTVLTGFAPRQWSWTNRTNNGIPITIAIIDEGLYTLQLAMREDGLRLDRILLTTNSDYTPTGDGPAESERVDYLEHIISLVP